MIRDSGSTAVAGTAGIEAPICSITDLSVRFPTRRSGGLNAVEGLSLDILPGETVGIVGESGSGKSVTALAILGLLPSSAAVAGSVVVDGHEMTTLSEKELSKVRGSRVGLITQDPSASLNPVRKVGRQLAEALRTVPREEARQRIATGLAEVGLDADRVVGRYPFELSGGMNQRIVIAMALLQEPRLLIADEPTTALDVTTQAGIVALLERTRRDHGTSMLFISHDLGVVGQLATRIGVMYGGRLVEIGPRDAIIENPQHPYSKALIESVPELGRPPRSSEAPVAPPERRSSHDGCPYVSRCPISMPVCGESFPPATPVADDHDVWCWAVGGEVAS